MGGGKAGGREGEEGRGGKRREGRGEEGRGEKSRGSLVLIEPLLVGIQKCSYLEPQSVSKRENLTQC